MRIDKITINEFGALKDRTFSLKNGINVFEGRNEVRFDQYGSKSLQSGKTICNISIIYYIRYFGYFRGVVHPKA